MGCSLLTARLVSLTAFLCFTLLSLTSLSTPLTAAANAADGDGILTAYEALEEFDFPAGLLPKGAKGYDLDRATGKFSAYLNGDCSFSLEGSYQLKYKSTITGIISKDKLTDLKGVTVKILFLWVNIIEVIRDGNELQFSVGIASANFPIENFYESPECGCGLDCVNGQVRKVRSNPFVSSS